MVPPNREPFPVREYYQYLPTCDFIKDQAAASQLSSSTGIPYTDALRQVNYQTQQQRQAEEEAKKQQLARQTSQQLLLDEMNKYAKAKLGEVPRREMPQVCACEAEESDDIPTGKLEFVSPDKLKKTQEKINKTKARGIANDWANAGKEPVLISRDNWILDGHHRVEAAKTLGKLVRVVRVDLPGHPTRESAPERRRTDQAGREVSLCYAERGDEGQHREGKRTCPRSPDRQVAAYSTRG